MDATQPKALQPFVLAMPAEFWWTVRVPLAVANDYEYAGLDVLFAPVDQAELDKMRGQGLAEGELPPTDDAIARRVVRDWRLKDDSGHPVPFTADALTSVLRVPMVRTAMVATYLAAMSGMAARKNA